MAKKEALMLLLVVALAGIEHADDTPANATANLTFICSWTPGVNYYDRSVCLQQCYSNPSDCQPVPPPKDYTQIFIAFSLAMFGLVMGGFVYDQMTGGDLSARIFSPKSANKKKMRPILGPRGDVFYRFFIDHGVIIGTENRKGLLMSADKKSTLPIRDDEWVLPISARFLRSPPPRLIHLPTELLNAKMEIEQLRKRQVGLLKTASDAWKYPLDATKTYSVYIGEIGKNIHMAPIIVGAKSTGGGYEIESQKKED